MPKINNSTNWRQHVESTSTQVVQCESVLPVDTESNRNPLVFNIRASPGLVVDTKNIKLAFTVSRLIRTPPTVDHGQYLSMAVPSRRSRLFWTPAN